MQWIEIYSVDSIIHPLSNWDQHCIPSNRTFPNKFSYKFRKRENGTRKAKKGRMTQPRHFAFYECLILGDPGADSGGEGKSKQAGKCGTKEK